MRSALRRLLIYGLAWLLRPLVRQAPAGAPTRVLVIKPDHLGDVLLLTPALRALRAGLPGAQITALVGPWSTIVLRGNPDLDALRTCEFPGFTRAAKGPLWQPYLLLLATARALRAERFDAVLIARDDHWWGALLGLAAGIPRRIGYAHPLVAPALSEALPWDPAAHVTRQGLALVERLTGASAGQPAQRFVPSPQEQRWAADWLERHGLGARPLVAIHPGSAGLSKLWPVERWAAVADALAAEADIVLTGGPDEAALVASVAQIMRAPSTQMVGAASLGGLAALYACCRLVLGPDTGPLHIAVSQAVATIHLFGPSDHVRFGPWGGARNILLRSGLWCSPCGVITHCPRATDPVECMALISVEQVLGMARQLLHEPEVLRR